jgi:hypothetical protein
MLNRFEGLSLKNKIILAVVCGLVLFMIPAVGFVLFLKRTNTSNPAPAVLEFKYCAASPRELCILSFGRDGAGDAILNFFVPDRRFPPFYVVIKSAGTESRYTCKRNSEIKTSVFCSGEPLSLKQTIEVHLFAESDNHLLATGKFLIEAFLVATPGGDPLAATNAAVESPSATQTEETPIMIETPTAEPSRNTPYPDGTSYP